MKKYSHYLPYGAGFAISLIFGLSFMFTKQALDSFTPMLLLAFRFALAALTLTVLTVFGLVKVQFRGKPIKELLILAFFQPIAYFICETIGVKLTSSSEAGMLIALIPVAVTILAVVFLHERPSVAQYLSIFTSVAGVAFIILMSGQFSVGGHFLGILVLLGAVAAAAVYNILSRKLSTSFNPVEITFVMMWVGAIVFNIAALVEALTKDTLSMYANVFHSSGAMFSILYLGIISSICAFFMLNFMLSKMTASRSAVFSNLTTVISIIAGVTIKHEAFHWYQLVGGIMIILGVWGTNYFGRQKPTDVQEEKAA